MVGIGTGNQGQNGSQSGQSSAAQTPPCAAGPGTGRSSDTEPGVCAQSKTTRQHPEAGESFRGVTPRCDNRP